MPRPVLVVPLWAGAGEGRGCQFALLAAALITSISRLSLVWRSLKATGSAAAVAASSSMKDSIANVFWSRVGERKGPVNSQGWYTPYERTRWFANVYHGSELEPSSPRGGDAGGDWGGATSGNPARTPVGMLPGGAGRPPRLALQF